MVFVVQDALTTTDKDAAGNTISARVQSSFPFLASWFEANPKAIPAIGASLECVETEGRGGATVILPGETETGSQPCQGIAWRAHREDERGRGGSASALFQEPHRIGKPALP